MRCHDAVPPKCQRRYRIHGTCAKEVLFIYYFSFLFLFSFHKWWVVSGEWRPGSGESKQDRHIKKFPPSLSQPRCPISKAQRKRSKKCCACRWVGCGCVGDRRNSLYRFSRCITILPVGWSAGTASEQLRYSPLIWSRAESTTSGPPPYAITTLCLPRALAFITQQYIVASNF